MAEIIIMVFNMRVCVHRDGSVNRDCRVNNCMSTMTSGSGSSGDLGCEIGGWSGGRMWVWRAGWGCGLGGV